LLNKNCYEPFCLGVNTHIAIARQHMAMLETESNIGTSLHELSLGGNQIYTIPVLTGSWPLALSSWAEANLACIVKLPFLL